MRIDRPLAISLLLLALALPARAAETYRLDLRDAGPDEIARALEKALGAPVEVRGGQQRRISLALTTALPSTALDRVARLLGGAWRTKLRVADADPVGQPPPPSTGRPVERNLSLGLQDVPAGRAFGYVARELKAELETLGDPDLDRRVTLYAFNQPAARILDQIAAQAGATWSLRYEIEAPDAPPPADIRDIILRGPALPPAAPTASPPRPALISPPPLPSAAGLRDSLWTDLNRLVRVEPDQRAAAIREFLDAAGGLLRPLEALPLEERRAYLAPARPILTSWRRLYDGLAPNLKKELAPVTRFLDQALR